MAVRSPSVKVMKYNHYPFLRWVCFIFLLWLKDIDECWDQTDNCNTQNAKCVNTEGGFTCVQIPTTTPTTATATTNKPSTADTTVTNSRLISAMVGPSDIVAVTTKQGYVAAFDVSVNGRQQHLNLPPGTYNLQITGAGISCSQKIVIKGECVL